MKLWISAGLVAASLALSACQSTAIPGAVTAGQAQHSNNLILAKIVSPVQQQLIYFSKSGQYSKTPVPGGFERRVLGKTASGGWVAQDFYRDSQSKQTNAFVIFHPEGLRNFDNDVIDGPVVWYRPDGSVEQSTTFARGKLNGWYIIYDNQNHPRQGMLFDHDKSGGHWRSYDERGHLQMEWRNGQLHRTQTFWYPDGKKAILREGDAIQGWAKNGEALSQEKATELWVYLTSLLYQAQD